MFGLNRNTQLDSALRHFFNLLVCNPNRISFLFISSVFTSTRNAICWLIFSIFAGRDFQPNILEPFCGIGTVAEEIKKAGYEVIAYDIVDRGYGKVADFKTLEVERGKFDVISNPPYDEHLIDNIHKCLDICHDKVALLLPLDHNCLENCHFYPVPCHFCPFYCNFSKILLAIK